LPELPLELALASMIGPELDPELPDDPALLDDPELPLDPELALVPDPPPDADPPFDPESLPDCTSGPPELLPTGFPPVPRPSGAADVAHAAMKAMLKRPEPGVRRMTSLHSPSALAHQWGF
jgi:hypothetical protein